MSFFKNKDRLHHQSSWNKEPVNEREIIHNQISNRPNPMWAMYGYSFKELEDICLDAGYSLASSCKLVCNAKAGYSKSQLELLKLINKHRKSEMTMTREEAIKKCHGINYPEAFIQSLEALGLIKFEGKTKVETLMHIHQYGNHGDIKIEDWPEGLVLWVGGRIRWKEWETYLTPKQIYENHMKSGHDNKWTSYYGLAASEIFEAIELWKKEKNK